MNLKLEELRRFNPDTYARLIRYLKEHYTIVPFREIPKEDIPYVILRHDVDVSISAALKMAQAENNMGLKSTYFILVSSKHYNVLHGENADMIRQMSKLGHEIGLHYDVEQYRRYCTNVDEALKMEVNALESLLGQKVGSVSCHAPKGASSFMNVDEYLDADNPHLRDIYVHDSGRLWTVKSLAVLLNEQPKRVQLLVHPCFWEGKTARRTRLDDLFLDALLSLYRVRTLTMRLIHSKESCEN